MYCFLFFLYFIIPSSYIPPSSGFGTRRLTSKHNFLCAGFQPVCLGYERGHHPTIQTWNQTSSQHEWLDLFILQITFGFHQNHCHGSPFSKLCVCPSLGNEFAQSKISCFLFNDFFFSGHFLFSFFFVVVLPPMSRWKNAFVF